MCAFLCFILYVQTYFLNKTLQTLAYQKAASHLPSRLHQYISREFPNSSEIPINTTFAVPSSFVMANASGGFGKLTRLDNRVFAWCCHPTPKHFVQPFGQTFCITRLILESSCIRFGFVCNRPAVSMMITSACWGNTLFHGIIRSSGGIGILPRATGTPTLAPFCCSAAAARMYRQHPTLLSCLGLWTGLRVCQWWLFANAIHTHNHNDIRLNAFQARKPKSASGFRSSAIRLSLLSEFYPTPDEPKYLSRATHLFKKNPPMIFDVVSTPTSLEMRISSGYQSTSASTVVLPIRPYPTWRKSSPWFSANQHQWFFLFLRE